MLWVCRRIAGHAKAGDFGAALDAWDQSHQSRVHALEVKEEEHAARHRGVPVIETGLRQIKRAGLFEGRGCPQRPATWPSTAIKCRA